MNQKDPYQILGVTRSASQDEIKRTYRRLAKQYHPDRNPGDKSSENKFKEVQAAYEVLGDPERRAQFDQFGAGGPRPDFQSWTSGGSPFQGVNFDFGNGGDLSSIFEQFFRQPRSRGRSRMSPRQAPQKPGPDLERTVDLSFEEAVQGTTRDVVIASETGPAERIQVRIPPGVSHDQRIRVKGKGHPGPGGRGNLMIHCRVKPHPFFKRDGNDLFLDLPLTFAEAACGTKIDIPTLDGVTRLTIPPGTSGGTKLRLRGKGINSKTAPGDLYVVTKIAIPKNSRKKPPSSWKA